MSSSGWDVVRPAGPGQLAGVRMAGFRGPTPVPHRTIPRPAVTLALEVGTGSIMVDDARGRQTGSLIAGVGFADGVFHGQGSTFEAVMVHLSPLVAGTVLGMPLSDLQGVTTLRDVWAPRVLDQVREAPSWDARFALIEAALVPRHPARAVDPEVVRAWQQLVRAQGLVRVDELAASIGWSRKRLWSRFQAQLGLTPKRAAMLLRFDHATAGLAAGSELAAVATASGYADQSHLHRDVVAFTGSTPAEVARAPWAALTTHELAPDEVATPSGATVSGLRSRGRPSGDSPA